MKFETDAVLLTAESKPYSVNGNEGTSHKVRLNIGGEIYKCNATADQVEVLKASQGNAGTAVVQVESRKENLSIKLVSFIEE